MDQSTYLAVKKSNPNRMMDTTTDNPRSRQESSNKSWMYETGNISSFD